MMNKIFSTGIAALLLLGFALCNEPVKQTPPPQTPLVSAITSSKSIADRQIKVWDVAIKQVIELAEAIPEDKLNYKPHDSMMTFAEQLVHIGESSVFITNAFLKDIPRPKNRVKIKADSMNKAELIAFVQDRLMAARANMEGMTNKQLTTEEVTSFVGNKMSRLEGMMLAHDHLTNHKAKVNLYLRLIDITPPKWQYY